MAGLLMVRPGADWVVSGGLFDWTLEFLIDRLSDPAAIDRLRTVVDNNLGSVSLADLPDGARRQALAALRDHLVEAGRRGLPESPVKPDVIGRLQELADLAAAP